MAPGALELSCPPQKQSMVLWCSEATVLLMHCSTSGWYYWRRQIKGLEGFWQVDKCCLTRQSTGQTVRCSLTALTLHPSATKGFELVSHTHTQNHGFIPSYEAIKCLNWLCLGGWIKEWIFFFLPKPWKRATLELLPLKLLRTGKKALPRRYLLNITGSAQGQKEKLIMT